VGFDGAFDALRRCDDSWELGGEFGTGAGSGQLHLGLTHLNLLLQTGTVAM